jgi:hypothetical protein
MTRPASFRIAHCSRPGCAICESERRLSRGERRALLVISAWSLLVGALLARAWILELAAR